MRRGLVVILLLLLATWPLAHRYTSLGVDVDTARGSTIDTRNYRLRWPGDGSVLVGWIDEHRPAAPGEAGGTDLGGDFLRPARPMTPQSTWNRIGFWWVDVEAARGDAPSDAAPRADQVKLLGLPHWGLVLLALAGVLLTRRGGARSTKGRARFGLPRGRRKNARHDRRAIRVELDHRPPRPSSPGHRRQ